MYLNTKDRRISIWVGVIIGVAISSLLFKYAITKKNQRASFRIGSYDSNITAINATRFPKVPSAIKKSIPHGIILYYEKNKSVSGNFINNPNACWVIECAGSLRSERLFILAETSSGKPESTLFFRASELYISVNSGISQQQLEKLLPESEFRILGKNKMTKEFIVQIKEFSPDKIKNYLNQLSSQYPQINKVRLCRWLPPT
jgi:hypothetical protein